MKNLKKVLSVALALAMALSLMTTAFAAAPKASDLTGYNNVGTTYTQAVDMMVGLGVINGVSGDIQAQGNVTREQAAKIVCTMLLGSDASQLSTTSSYFSDVAATRWSAPYIAYCVENGIVSGVGGGKFNPTGNVTGNQFAKMLLVALGYKADTEGYTGTNWAVNVSSDAADAGIFKGATALNKNAAATREQACLYAWNTVKATLVEYTNPGTSITIGDTSINVGGTKATPKTSTTLDTRANLDGTIPGSDSYTVQFGEKYFTTLKKDGTTSSDAFGRPATQYKVGTTTIGTYADTAAVTYTAATLASKVASDLSGYTISYNNTSMSINNTTSYSSGTALGSILYANSKDPASFSTSSAGTLAAAIAGLTANGKTVEIYADTNNVITRITTITYAVGKVTSVTSNTVQTSYSIGNGAASGIDYADAGSADTISIKGTIAKGDIVTYVKPAGSIVTYVYPTTSFSGAEDSKSSYYSTITVGGTSYKVGLGVTNVTMELFSNSNKTANYYVDINDFVVATTASAASTDYAYIIGKYGTTTTTVDGTVPSAQLKVVKADGSVTNYTLKLTKLTADNTTTYTYYYDNGEGTVTHGTATGDVGDYIITGTTIGIYAASTHFGTTSSSDFYHANTAPHCTAASVNEAVASLADVVGYTISDTTISVEPLVASGTNMASGGVYFDTDVDTIAYGKTSVATTETVLFNSSTLYVVYNTAKGTAAVYTGNTGLPTTATNGTIDDANVVMKASGAAIGTANVVFVTVANAFSSAATNDYVYVNASKYSSGLSSTGSTLLTYYATKADGTTLNLTSTTTISADGIYSYNSDNSINTTPLCVISDISLTNHYYIYDATMVVADNMVNVGGNYYNMTDDTKVVYTNSALTEVNGNGGYVVLAANSTNTAPTSNIAAIFVTAGTASYALTGQTSTIAFYSDAECTNSISSAAYNSTVYAKSSAFNGTISSASHFALTQVQAPTASAENIVSFAMPGAALAAGEFTEAYPLTAQTSGVTFYSAVTCAEGEAITSATAGTVVYMKASAVNQDISSTSSYDITPNTSADTNVTEIAHFTMPHATIVAGEFTETTHS